MNAHLGSVWKKMWSYMWKHLKSKLHYFDFSVTRSDIGRIKSTLAFFAKPLEFDRYTNNYSACIWMETHCIAEYLFFSRPFRLSELKSYPYAQFCMENVFII